MNTIARTSLSVCLVLTWCVCGSVWSGDWPQILGPNRDGIAVDEPEITPWSKAGLKPRWSVPLGAGFAGPAIAGDRVIVFHRLGKDECVECLDRSSGKSLWRFTAPASYPGGVNPDNGPRCVPLIHNQRIYVFGAAGNVHCVALADGKNIWSRDAYADYQGQEGYFGAGATPILVDGKLLVNVGGRQAGIVAFDADTGRTVWQATDDRASYSSPTIAAIDGKTVVIFVTRQQCVALDPANGQIRFQFPFGKTGPTVNAATPLAGNHRLFLSASYGVGARMMQLRSGMPPQQIWANDESMSSQYTTCVYRQGFLYGIHGREDFNNGELRCVDATTGKVHWTVGGFGVGHLILVRDRLLILTTDGQLVLAAASPDRFEELARATVSQTVTRALPALSSGHLFFRENPERVGGQLICLPLH